jgi:hypothetical protein
MGLGRGGKISPVFATERADDVFERLVERGSSGDVVQDLGVLSRT